MTERAQEATQASAKPGRLGRCIGQRFPGRTTKLRILAVDPGSKRVGLAVSDPTGTIATGLSTIPAEPASTLASRLAGVAKAQDATRIIVGLPIQMDGKRGPAAAAATELSHGLRQASGLPVELVDERLTTVAAERSLIAAGVRREKRKLSVDRVAATLLLQAHLDRSKRDR